MPDKSLYIVNKAHNEKEETNTYLNTCFLTKIFKSCRDLPKVKTERPLLQPAIVTLFFTSELSIEEITEEINYLNPETGDNKLYSVLFVDQESRLSQLRKLMKESDDFLTQNSSAELIVYKIEQLITHSNSMKKLSRDLNEASEIALLSMANSSELGEISRFILASYNCQTYDELLDALFETVKTFNIHCSALIVVDDSVITRLSENATEDVQKTMLIYHNQGRIHHFGDETIITFAHASIMVHDMPVENTSHYGRLLDNLTVLGNCFEARAKGIHAEQEAYSASRAKTLFLATMSHELRTPMNSVIGFTERLMKKLEGRLNEREQKHLNAIKRNGDHLLQVINDILDVSKIEVGKMEIHPERINATERVNDIYLQMQPIAQNKSLDFKLHIPEEPIHIHADPLRFTQMVMNLVSNAIKYTPSGSVNIALTENHNIENEECVCIAVEDTGIGISEKDQKKLFENFVQIDSELSRKIEGTGLGLAISLFFCKMHGGKIEVRSEEDQGSCFSLYLPISDKCHLGPINVPVKNSDQAI